MGIAREKLYFAKCDKCGKQFVDELTDGSHYYSKSELEELLADAKWVYHKRKWYCDKCKRKHA